MKTGRKSDFLLLSASHPSNNQPQSYVVFLITHVRKRTGGGALRAISRLAAPLLQSCTKLHSFAYSPQNTTLPRTASTEGNGRFFVSLTGGSYQFGVRQARAEPAREKPLAFRTELNGIERRERIAGAEKYVARKEFAPKLWFWGCRTLLFAE